ncbi:MAG TPA: HWE histidine kinase domain-containing protein [Caulobacteraceae bacterium]|nr:HWE histidine kinase domain-containing protein [Caulobacteraceae bacterium]
MRAPSLLRGQLLALGCVAVAVVARIVTGPMLGADSPFMVFVPAILAASLLGGYLAGATAILTSIPIGLGFFAAVHPGRPLASFAWLGGSAALVGVLLAGMGGFMGHTLRALARSENRFRTLATATNRVILRFDDTLEVLRPNPEWRRLTGHGARTPWREAFHPEEAGRIPQRPEAPVQVEARLRHAPHGEARWVRMSLVPVREGGRTVEWLGAVEDIHDRKSGDELNQMLAGELAHRAKNGIAVVQAIISQSARQAGTAAELERIVQARIGAMASAQDVIAAGGNNAALLGELVTSTLAPFGLERFRIVEDRPMVVGRNLALTLGLILHELATNATKYGALSTSDGRVELRTARPNGKPPLASIAWRETGGPAVSASNNVGFGGRLLQTGLRSFGGAAELRLPPDGAQCDLKFPAEAQ